MLNCVYELRLLKLSTLEDAYVNTVDSLKKARQWQKCNIPNSDYVYYFIQKNKEA